MGPVASPAQAHDLREAQDPHPPRRRRTRAVGADGVARALLDARVMSAFRHILVPTDFGESSARALDLALEIAAKFDSQVTVLHAGWVPTQYFAAYSEVLAMPASEIAKEARKELDEAVKAAQKRHARVEGEVVTGDAPERILDFAKEHGVDTIVMGTHGRRGIPRVLLGSVAEKVVRLSPVPVLTVRAAAAPPAA